MPEDYRVGVINVSVAGAKIELWGKDTYKTYLDSAETWMQNIHPDDLIKVTNIRNTFLSDTTIDNWSRYHIYGNAI